MILGSEQERPHIDDAEFRLLAENIPTLCWMANADGSIFWFNRRWHDYCGSTHEEMKGWGWQSVHDPAALPAIMERWKEAHPAGKPIEMVMPLRGADGVFRPFITRLEPVRDDAGAVVRWIGVHTDISAQVDTDAKLAVVTARLHTLASFREAMLGQLAEGVIITDHMGKIVFVNEAANKLHGVAQLDVEPDDYAEAYSLFTLEGEPHPSETLPLTRAVLNEETVIGARWLIRRPDGSEVLAIGNAQPVHGEDGGKIGAVLTIHDDTQRHAAEIALAEAAAAKEALLYEVNHRVKNSLQIVTSLLTLQGGSGASPELRHALSEARSRVDLVAGIHRRLYTEGAHGSIDLTAYVREFASETIEAFAVGSVIELALESNSDVRLDMDQAVPIALIVGELLTNAVKYAFAGRNDRCIAITIAETAHNVRITVSDNGIGLPAGFDPAAAKGLGMTIVNALTGQLAGRFETVPQDAGAGFAVTFPKRTAIS